MKKDKMLKSEKKDREKYFDNVILKVVEGVDFGFWGKLIDLIMKSTDEEYKKYKRDYPELLSAIDRYNSAHQNIQNSKLIRRSK